MRRKQMSGIIWCEEKGRESWWQDVSHNVTDWCVEQTTRVKQSGQRTARITVTLIQVQDLVNYVLSVCRSNSPHHGKSPPAPPQSASNTQVITSAYSPYLAKTDSKQRLSVSKPRDGCREEAFRIIIFSWRIKRLHTLQYHEPERNMASCLSQPGETEH